MAATRRALEVTGRKPRAHALRVTAVAAALVPRMQPAHRQLADAAPRARRLVLRARRAAASDRDRRRPLIQLLHPLVVALFDDRIRQTKELKPVKLLHIAERPFAYTALRCELLRDWTERSCEYRARLRVAALRVMFK